MRTTKKLKVEKRIIKVWRAAMSWGDIMRIVGTAIMALGGGTVIVFAAVNWCGDRIAECLKAKYELENSKELESFKNEFNEKLESYKSSLENQRHISKAMFDREFGIYENLADMVSEILLKIATLEAVKKSGKEIIPASEISINNPALRVLGERIESGEVFTEIQLKKERKDLFKYLFSYRKVVSVCPFIPLEMQELFMSVYDKCTLWYAERDGQTATYEDVESAVYKMQVELNKYLNSLIIIGN